jgi:hypothetical protein
VGEILARFTGADDDEICRYHSPPWRHRWAALFFLTLVFDLRVKIQILSDRATTTHLCHPLVEGVPLEPLSSTGAHWLGTAPFHHRAVVFA